MPVIFSAVRDREIIEAGGFLCKACLVGKPISEQSPNTKYCVSCYEFIKEAEQVDNWKLKTTLDTSPNTDKTSPVRKNKAIRASSKESHPRKVKPHKFALQPLRRGRPKKNNKQGGHHGNRH